MYYVYIPVSSQKLPRLKPKSPLLKQDLNYIFRILNVNCKANCKADQFLIVKWLQLKIDLLYNWLYNRVMESPQQKILKFAKTKISPFKTSEIVALLKLSRQAAAAHLKRLVEQGELVKTGSTHNATYRIKKKTDQDHIEKKVRKLTFIKILAQLEEDRVFEELRHRLALNNLVNKNVSSIAYYSFSEMMNNAIEHSGSEKAKIEVEVQNGYFQFKIMDFGIGIFENVKKGFKLEDELHGAEQVFKGKQTTMPERHSGQGIFFTSRIADRFEIHSHKLRAVIDNEKEDTYFSDAPYLKGTLVTFRIKQNSRKNLPALFESFASEKDSYEFNKNEVRVRLTSQTELISRSQARRLLAGLDEFKQIIFDFKGMNGIGQAFSDEIFRVYARLNPEKKISYVNASPAVKFMIERISNFNP
jgi:anti-sigma regulatory factor (Ser/Thr protein kinase)